MIDKLKDNLASVAALIAAVAAIGGGFVKYGEISTRLSQIEAAQGETVDVSGIVVNAEDIAVLKEKVSNTDPFLLCGDFNTDFDHKDSSSFIKHLRTELALLDLWKISY